MRALKFIGHNIVMAKDQKEYRQLPAFAKDGVVITQWQLTDDEVAHIVKTQTVIITRMCFNYPGQPIRVSASRPAMPYDRAGKLISNPQRYDNETDTCQFELKLIPIALDEIQKTKTLWITTATYGAAMQPIAPTIK